MDAADEHDAGGGKRLRGTIAGGGGGAAAWRVCRVARAAAGGKDRHSKVVTARGLRDRRVRLSVPTAIQFYDLQDRLGVDQPSKAIEWLIRAAAAAIDALPSLSASFPSSAPDAEADANADANANAEADGDADAEPTMSDTCDGHAIANANANANISLGSQGTFVELLATQPPPPAYFTAVQSLHGAAPVFEMPQPAQLTVSQETMGLTGFDRVTLQSNSAATTALLWPSHSHHHHQFLMQRFPAPGNTPQLPFFLGGGGGGAGNAERRLQFWDFKGEGKN